MGVKEESGDEGWRQYRFKVGETVWYLGTTNIYEATVVSQPSRNLREYGIRFEDAVIGWVTEYYSEFCLHATKEAALFTHLDNLLYSIKRDAKRALEVRKLIAPDIPDLVVLKDIDRQLEEIQESGEFAYRLVLSAVAAVEMAR